MHFLGQSIAIIRHSRRRSMTIKMGVHRGIEVHCAMSTMESSIESFLLLKQKWILKNLRIFEDYKAKQIPLVFEPGQKFPLFGEELSLKVTAANSKKVGFKKVESELHLLWPESLDGTPEDHSEPLKKVLQKFYRSQAELFLFHRTYEWAHKTGLMPNNVRLKNQRTRWGSCSSRATINLNYRIIAAPVFVIDYLIVHELAHLKHMNHSQHFWSLVESFVPDYRRSESWLDAHGPTLDFLI